MAGLEMIAEWAQVDIVVGHMALAVVLEDSHSVVVVDTPSEVAIVDAVRMVVVV